MPEIASLVENGRAVLYPIYKGTFDRVSSLRCVTPNETSLYRTHLIAWSKDLGRAIDYLESRPDVDGEKLAFLGQGWGAMMGAILPAVESRLKVAVLVGGGFFTQRTTPDLDQVNFAPRVNIPTLMLNGRFSPYVPLKSVVEPMFRLLGCPESNKRLIVYESSLFIPPEERDRETLAWLDKYLEPVNVQPNAQ
jgi:pimeloyl-ACP methyl ester carboxylesterase